MKTLALTLAAFILVGLNARAEEDKAAKLLGKWEAVKGQLPAGSTIEFGKEGKITVSVKQEGKTEKHAGTYKLDGGKINVTRKYDGEERTRTFKVKKLTDEVLVTEDDKGKTTEFKRVK
jgi:uncharacterized protein (TIGR03066 family)